MARSGPRTDVTLVSEIYIVLCCTEALEKVDRKPVAGDSAGKCSASSIRQRLASAARKARHSAFYQRNHSPYEEKLEERTRRYTV